MGKKVESFSRIKDGNGRLVLGGFDGVQKGSYFGRESI